MPDMQFPRSRLIVFCKAPDAGNVKSRLATDIDQRGVDGKTIAAKIHEYLARHIIALATQARLATVELWCSPDTTHPFFQQCKESYGVTLCEQGRGDLGERMSRAFQNAFHNEKNAIVIGTDCPVYSVALLQRALVLLRQNELQQTDCSVIAPAEDGGYPLLGLSSPKEAIFRDLEWGNAKVFSETVSRLKGKVEILDTLWDVDRVQDLGRLIKESRTLGLEDDFIDYLDSIAFLAE